ncbi:MAG: FtsX-like permease family protein, partial [Bacteroidota bacterium]
DTTLVIDSVEQQGVMVYDTTENIGEATTSHSISSPSFKLLDEYLRDLPYVEKMSAYSPNHSFDIFLNSSKLTFAGTYTDAAYWEIFNFRFLEGGPFRPNQVDNRLPVAILSEEARTAYFGSNVEAVGKTVVVNQTNFEVVGVVEDVSPAKQALHADVYMPYTFMRTSDIKDNSLMGPFEGAFLLSDVGDMPYFDSELRRQQEIIPLPNPDDYNHLELVAYNTVERFAFGLFHEDDKEDGMQIFLLVFGGLTLLFILLPTLNLINVNVTRIMERSSEIGVRKAFGANTRHLLVQFLFENIILTLIGGLIGCLMAIGLIYLINDSKVLADLTLKFNPTVFFYGFLVTLFFGILSGLLPALRMSRLHVVKALKENAI